MRRIGGGVLALAISGALLSLTQATFAQVSRTTPWIGVLHAGNETPNAIISGFRHGLKELGYSDGQNIHIEHRWAQGRLDRLNDLALELVGLNVDVLVAAVTQPPLQRKRPPTRSLS